MHNRGNHRFFVIARLKDGVSVAQAYSELDGIQQRIHQQFPNELAGKGANVVPLSENLVRNVKASLYLLMGAGGLRAADCVLECRESICGEGNGEEKRVCGQSGAGRKPLADYP